MNFLRFSGDAWEKGQSERRQTAPGIHSILCQFKLLPWDYSLKLLPVRSYISRSSRSFSSSMRLRSSSSARSIYSISFGTDTLAMLQSYFVSFLVSTSLFFSSAWRTSTVAPFGMAA